MQLTQEVLDFIKQKEGTGLPGKPFEAYEDTGGVWTIGYGHTSMAGPPKVKPGMKITKAEAEDIFLRDIMKFADGVRRLLKVELPPNKFSACVSFAYNVGLEQFRTSTFLSLINKGKLEEAGPQLLRWVYDNGVKLEGLVRRREAELAMWNADNFSLPDVEPVPLPVEPDEPQKGLDPVLRFLLLFGVIAAAIGVGIAAIMRG